MFNHLNLNTKLILTALLSLLLSLAVFASLRYCVNQMLYAHYTQVYEQISMDTRAELIIALFEDTLDIEDEKSLQAWLDERSISTGLALYDEEGWYVASTSPKRFKAINPDLQKLEQLVRTDVYTHQLLRETPVGMRNGIWLLVVYGYIPPQVLHITLLIELLLSVGVFFFFFQLLTRKRMKDFLLLEAEIQRMQSGDLEHPIAVSGSDQLSRLAGNLEQLRHTLLNQILTEEEAKKANNQLITAMSHDLRTPLTVLTGYLQIVNSHKCKTSAQQEKYLILAEKKACQIRELSDRLFEYSLVFGTDELLSLERTDGKAFLKRLVEERAPELSAHGFHPEFTWNDRPSATWFLEINPQATSRVWDNLFSNILKYGIPSAPLLFSFTFSEGMLTIRLSNETSQEKQDRREGSGIGLKSCLRLMEKQQGSFTYETEEHTFTAELGFPIYLL